MTSESDIYSITDYTKLPVYENLNDYHIFFRGLFDKHGDINYRSLLNNEIECNIFDNNNLISTEVIDKIKELYKIDADEYYIVIKGVNAFDFLSLIYKNSDARYRNNDNYEEYVSLVTHKTNISRIPVCKFKKVHEDAVTPFKSRASDVGYDLTVIKEVKKISDKTILYDTGVIVQPEFGFYTKIVPRSSLVKSGYMLKNSIGIIDSSYLGTLKIALIKVDDSLPDLELPFCCCQLILDRFYHYELDEVDSFDETSRGEGGFGSTNKT